MGRLGEIKARWAAATAEVDPRDSAAMGKRAADYCEAHAAAAEDVAYLLGEVARLNRARTEAVEGRILAELQLSTLLRTLPPELTTQEIAAGVELARREWNAKRVAALPLVAALEAVRSKRVAAGELDLRKRRCGSCSGQGVKPFTGRLGDPDVGKRCKVCDGAGEVIGG